MQIGAALLVGGESRRMGRNKAQLLADGETFQARIAAQLSMFPERLLSVGGRAVSLPGFVSVPDRYPACGPLGGIHAVLSFCRSDALLVVSCDIPMFPEALGRFLAEVMSEGDDAVIPVTRDGREHPVCGVYRRTVLPKIQEQLEAGDYRMREFLRRIRVRRIYLAETSFPDDCLANINTDQEYQALLARYQTGDRRDGVRR